MNSEIAPEPFTMNGEKHTLTFEKEEIYMASEKKLLVVKLNNAIKCVKNNKNVEEFGGKSKNILTNLEELRTENRDVNTELHAAEKIKDGRPNKRRE